MFPGQDRHSAEELELLPKQKEFTSLDGGRGHPLLLNADGALFPPTFIFYCSDFSAQKIQSFRK